MVLLRSLAGYVKEEGFIFSQPQICCCFEGYCVEMSGKTWLLETGGS